MARGNWSYMLLAFIMSLSLWYMVVGQARVEQPITLRIEYSGMPSNLVIKSGLVQDITIQLRGPRGLIRTASDARYTYTVDLSHIKKGINTVPLTTKDLPFTRAFEVVDMKPSRLNLEVDTLVEREIPVDVYMREGMPAGLEITNFTWKPDTVTVRGPESVVSEIVRLSAEIPPPTQASNRRITGQASIVVPALVDTMPVQVDVSYYANVAMREMVITRTLNHAVNLEHFSVSPHQVSVRLSIPELQAEDEDFLQTITAYFEVGDEASYLSWYGNILGTHVQMDTNMAREKEIAVVQASPELDTLSTEQSDAERSNLDRILSPSLGDLSNPLQDNPHAKGSEELAALELLPNIAELQELPDVPLIVSGVDQELSDALSGASTKPHSNSDAELGQSLPDTSSEEQASNITELVLTTVPVLINAPPTVQILEIMPAEVEVMLR